MSIFKFLTKKSTLLCLALLVACVAMIPVEVFALEGDDILAAVPVTSTGPFAIFLQRGSQLFAYTRNALFVVAAGAFITYAWKAINDGEIEWSKLAMLIVALVLLGVAGFIVSFMANPDTPTSIQDQFKGLTDTQGWE